MLRSDLDGSNLEVVASDGLDTPNGVIALSDKIYIIDSFYKETVDRQSGALMFSDKFTLTNTQQEVALAPLLQASSTFQFINVILATYNI